MTGIDFYNYCPKPFETEPPVCLDTEGLILQALLTQWHTSEILPIQTEKISYGSSETQLTTVQARVLEYSYTIKPHGITNMLVLACEDVPGIEGAVTGTSYRRRVHRVFAGGAILGKWSSNDTWVRSKLRSPKSIEFKENQSYLDLLTSLLELCGHANEIGRHFRSNVTDYTHQYYQNHAQ